MAAVGSAPRDLTEDDRPNLNESLANFLIISGVPSAPASKCDKLTAVIKKIVKKLAPESELMHVELPLAANDKGDQATVGCAFLVFKDPAAAAVARAKLDNYPLDKKNTFRAVSFDKFKQILETPDEWRPQDITFEDQEDLYSWLLNADCEDQYALRHESMTSIFWNKRERGVEVAKRDSWTEKYVSFSPRGTYMASLHRQGVAVWGGKNWKRLTRFEHHGLHHLQWSPSERFMVTYGTETKEQQAYIIWDVKTGEKMRSFPDRNGQWPIFKWSHDDQFFARMKEDGISVFETSAMQLMGKKYISVPDIKDFQWSPTDNVIAYWVFEEGSITAKVTIISIPDRSTLAMKNLLMVKDTKLIWQESGSHLCALVERWNKSKKQTFTDIILFNLRAKNVPCDQQQIKEPIVTFAWEPKGSKFALIHGASPRISASFFQIQETGVALLQNVDKVEANTISWSPKGRYCVLAGINGYNGQMDFYDTNDMTKMNAVEHMSASGIAWDPTGRYLVTTVTSWHQSLDNGYWVWSFTGKLLQKHAVSQFWQFVWRPRPPTLLQPEHITKIKKNYKSFQTRFEAQDRMSQSETSKELIEQRQKLAAEFEQYLKATMAAYENIVPKLKALRPALEADEVVEGEETIEIYLRKEVEIVKKEDLAKQ